LRTLHAPSPSQCATIHTTHSSGEESMWFPHRMCRRRSHTLSLNRNANDQLLSEKRLNLVTQAISPRHQQHPEGARAREFRDSQGGVQTRVGRVVQAAGPPAFLSSICAHTSASTSSCKHFVSAVARLICARSRGFEGCGKRRCRRPLQTCKLPSTYIPSTPTS
jgi:hypothetical protein